MLNEIDLKMGSAILARAVDEVLGNLRLAAVATLVPVLIIGGMIGVFVFLDDSAQDSLIVSNAIAMLILPFLVLSAFATSLGAVIWHRGKLLPDAKRIALGNAVFYAFKAALLLLVLTLFFFLGVMLLLLPAGGGDVRIGNLVHGWSQSPWHAFVTIIFTLGFVHFYLVSSPYVVDAAVGGGEGIGAIKSRDYLRNGIRGVSVIMTGCMCLIGLIGLPLGGLPTIIQAILGLIMIWLSYMVWISVKTVIYAWPRSDVPPVPTEHHSAEA